MQHTVVSVVLGCVKKNYVSRGDLWTSSGNSRNDDETIFMLPHIFLILPISADKIANMGSYSDRSVSMHALYCPHYYIA